VSIWGWGKEERSWVYRWEQLNGDPSQPDVWRQLDELLTTRIPHQDGAALGISAAAIDAGYLTDKVWSFCQARTSSQRLRDRRPRRPRRKLIEAPDPNASSDRREEAPMHIIGVDTGQGSARSTSQAQDRRAERDAARLHRVLEHESGSVFYEQITAEEIGPSTCGSVRCECGS
jgi:phage terminase large subunit GpA-like protein